jgi:hypothetical protein
MLREEYPDLETLPSSLEVGRRGTLEVRTNMCEDRRLSEKGLQAGCGKTIVAR